jgi:hypothetical protein
LLLLFSFLYLLYTPHTHTQREIYVWEWAWGRRGGLLTLFFFLKFNLKGKKSYLQLLEKQNKTGSKSIMKQAAQKYTQCCGLINQNN